MLNVALVAPAGTWIEAGTCVAMAGLLTVTCRMLALVATDVSATVATEDPFPPTTEAGLKLIEAGARVGSTVTCPWTVTPCHVALTVAGVLTETVLVSMDSEAEKDPAGAVAVAGGATTGELLDRAIFAPPGGACPFSMIINCGLPPPVMELGLICSDFNEGGCTVN